MDRGVKRALIASLRTRPTRVVGRLRRGPKRDVQGLLCDLFAATTGSGHWEGDVFHSLDPDGNPHENVYTLPESVRRWAGISFPERELLEEANDHAMTNHELADLLEAGVL